MVSDAVIDRSRLEVKIGKYSVAPATALNDVSILARVQDYRRQAGSRMYPLEKTEISQKIPTADYLVSRKIDGEFNVLVYRDGTLLSINPGGTVRVGLPWQDEAVKILDAAGIEEAMIPGELYVSNDQDRRERVHDVTSIARQPGSEDDVQQLRFAVFDIVSLNGQEQETRYSDTWIKIEEIFGNGELVHPVETVAAGSTHEIEKLFDQWVVQQGGEGIVVRSDSGGFFKVKPLHTIDAVVIGFTESSDDRAGMMHDLLLAVMRKDSAMQVLCRVGGGFTEDLRREILSDLKDMIVESEYAEVNSDHVAYQMVRPEWVVEISCLDMISETTRGGPVNRMTLNWNSSDSKYEIIRRLPLVSVISPQFVRRREDKNVTPHDVRVKQIADIVEVPLIDRDASQMTLPKSELMRRAVYTKQLKGATMVRKFLMWKTNKETESDEFPSYVIHHTDFSPNRKTPLNRDICVSSSQEQILAQWDLLIEENIKKGWNIVGSDADTSEPGAEKPAKQKVPGKPSKKKTAEKVKSRNKQPEETPKKKATKKKAAKKAAKKSKK